MENRKGIEKILAPDSTAREEIRNKFKDISYYLIIALISIVVVFVVPLLSGALNGDLGYYFPSTAEGWFIYLTLKIGTAFGNVGIFVMFKLQAKTNVKNDPNFLRAKEILNEVSQRKRMYVPRSPREFNGKEYSVKGITVFLTSLLASITITSLIISFDLITFLSCIIATFIAVITGWVTMLKNEIYWTDEYLQYALYVKKELEDKGDKQC